MNRMTSRRVGAGSALLLVVFAVASGCGREQITTQRVRKEAAPPPAQVPPGHGDMASAALPQLKYSVPAGWTELPASGMSLVRFKVPGKDGGEGDVSVLALPGVSGKDLDVMNIFRERLSLAPLDEGGLSAISRVVPIGSAEGRLYTMSGEGSETNEAPRMLVAVLNQPEGSWYFRMTGLAGLVEAQTPAYLELLKSVSFGERVAAAAGGTPASGSADATAAASSAGLPAWTVPAGWKSVPPTSMLKARFLVEGADGKAEVTVSAFPGDVGGVAANVNRWRGQIGLAPLPESEARLEAKPVDIGGVGSTVTDLSGQREGKKVRLVGVSVPRGGETWFYKLVGDEMVAEREKGPLLEFARSQR